MKKGDTVKIKGNRPTDVFCNMDDGDYCVCDIMVCAGTTGIIKEINKQKVKVKFELGLASTSPLIVIKGRLDVIDK